ncbi:hypothetical protein [Malaciobacter mytili]|uniref:Uncharacterized protein n=1 Tax=Malaciobacter mytili LMG 24559 TaxID=1032238 RepID=A0AAX2AF76_9BACT|nr:hypothetical protein [Malaciobacter mytili]AXH15196.1 hypothetical protein AMYT_1621 [Malaciobacter mytili LMG 24559]RXI45411.1 hypothetical protein CRU99_03690 [Malaciobacter mytili]RXK15235.1 hypothetical protein CP985_09685 [Malaciobacter mytili LMG 24559]
MLEKEKIIEEIKKLIVMNDKETVEINPNFLQYFEIEELLAIKDKLEVKKSNISKSSLNYLDEIYEKTKKDKI